MSYFGENRNRSLTFRHTYRSRSTGLRTSNAYTNFLNSINFLGPRWSAPSASPGGVNSTRRSLLGRDPTPDGPGRGGTGAGGVQDHRTWVVGVFSLLQRTGVAPTCPPPGAARPRTTWHHRVQTPVVELQEQTIPARVPVPVEEVDPPLQEEVGPGPTYPSVKHPTCVPNPHDEPGLVCICGAPRPRTTFHPYHCPQCHNPSTVPGLCTTLGSVRPPPDPCPSPQSPSPAR